ncbi:Ig-like domain-containing protein [Steroidobacter sp.]|uniref:Ig-like domain-containing protein n=1 Tax=Steroidobacter sp. TaxID=1978227 RepID=UPI001A3B0E62|nr:Ig-like domain-containing protein [Steroidobacter sp.]MBL8267484.1 tandem-95 repeat protein [Steroidobacter sp.]
MLNLLRSWASATVALALMFITVGTSVAQAPSAYVTNLVLVSSTRYSSYLTDFTYRIQVVNQGGALANATATVSSSAAATTILDNEVILGNVAAGSTFVSTDTFILRQDRRVAFDPTQLSWTINAVNANTRPVANAGPDQTVRTGALVTLNGTGSTDADGDSLTYAWTMTSRPSGSTAVLSSSIAAMPTFTPDRGGTYVLSLIVNDGRVNSVADEVRISTVNSTPIANAGADRTVARASLVTLDGSASSDPDFDALSYTWVIAAAPQGSTALLSGANTVRPTIRLDLAGSYRFRLVVSDGQLSSTPDEVIISTENSAPVANAGPDQTGAIGAASQFDGSASHDADNDALSFSWTWQSRPNGSNAALNAVDVPVVSFVPDTAGLYVGQLIVNDGFANSVPDTAVVSVPLPVNRPPVAVDDAASTPAGTAVDVSVLANDTDPDAGSSLSIASFTQPSTGGTVTAIAGGLRFTPATGFTGVATFSYIVTDGSLTASATVTVTVVGASNAPPVVNAGADQNITLPYSGAVASITLSGTVSDDNLPAPPRLTSAWSQMMGPAVATISNATSTSTSVYLPTTGSYVFRLTANDGAVSASDDVIIVVSPATNTAPSLVEIGNRTIALGTSLSLHLGVSDADPFDTLTLSIGAGPAGATLTAPELLSWTPTAGQVGTHAFSITVRDAGGLSDTKTFNVTVTAANRAPTLAALSDDSIGTGANYSKVLSASDPDGDALTFELIEAPNGLTLTGSTLRWQPSQTGEFFVKVGVRDPAGARAAGVFKITVGSVSIPVARDDSYHVKFGETLSITAPGVLTNDADADGAALNAIRRSEPGLGSLTSFNNDGSFTYTAPTTDSRAPFAITARPLTTSIYINDVYTVPLVGDLNRDGYPDLVYDWYNQNHTAINGRDGSILWHADRATVEGCFDWLTSGYQRVLADIDDDGQLEYIYPTLCGNETRLVAIDSTGHTKWVSPSATHRYDAIACLYGNGYCPPEPTQVAYDMYGRTTPSVARLTPNSAPVLLTRRTITPDAGNTLSPTPDGPLAYHSYGCAFATGRDEDLATGCRVTLIISTTDGSVQQVLRAPPGRLDGSGLAGMGPFYDNFQPPFTADLDGDGQVEIISGSDVWRLVNGQWTLAWQTVLEPAQVAVADLDGDGRAEVVHFHAREGYGPYNGEPLPGFAGFIIYDANGVELRRMPLQPAGMSSFLTIADVDGDNTPELLMAANAMVYAMSTEGVLKWTFVLPDSNVNPAPYREYRQSNVTNVQVYDLDGDGVKEVLVSSLFGAHIIDGRNGKAKVNFEAGQRIASGRAIRMTFVADWNNDGHADIVSFGQGNGTLGGHGSFVISAANNDWLPAGKSFHQSQFRIGDIDDTGRVLYNPSIDRSFRNPRQLGTVRDPRETAGTSFEYAASNGSGTSTNARVFLTLAPDNEPPVITSRPPTAIQASSTEDYLYQLAATDPDAGDTITYSILSAPSWVSVNAATGAVRFDTGPCGSYGSPCDYGRVTVVLAATDSQGAQATQSFVVNVTTSTPATVLNVVGSLRTAAIQSLGAISLNAVVQQEQYSGQPVDTVIAQTPAAGASQPQGATVLITVSKGPAPAIVPNVVGRFETTASSALSSLGFTPTVTRVFSSTVEAGVVVSQSIAAGTETQPGAFTLVVSSGSGLDLRLSRSVTPANEPIAFSLNETDINGTPVGTPSASFSVTPVSGVAGGLPSVSNGSISPSATTRGRYRLTVTSSGRTSVAEFVVVQPNTVARPTQLALFAQFESTLITMDNLLAQANAARQAGDTATMAARMTAWVNTWRALDLDQLSFAVPVVTEDGFPPSVADMAGFGVTQSADDVLNKRILSDAASDLEALETALRSPTTPYSQIVNLFRNFNARAERVRAVAPGEYGIVDAKGLYAELLSQRIPRVIDAMVDDVASAFGLPARTRTFPGLASSYPGIEYGSLQEGAARALVAGQWDAPASVINNGEQVYLFSTLAETLTTVAVQAVVDAMGGGYTVRKFYQAAATSAIGGAAILAAARHIRSETGGADLTVTTASSLSINVFEADYSSMEGIGLNGAHPALNKVFVIGPELVNVFTDMIEKLKALGGMRSSASAVLKARNLDDIYDGLIDFYRKSREEVDAAQSAGQRISEELQNVFQTPSPHAAVSECLFEPGPLCSAITYESGFRSVYQSLGLNLPTPILFVVVNQETGEVLVGSPAFLPHR